MGDVDSSKPVLIVSVDPAEATFRLRMAILPKLLEDAGYRFDIVQRPAGFWARRALMAKAGRYHAVIIQRKLLDPSHARLLRRRARRVFFDLDDAVMLQRRRIGRISAWLKRRRFWATAAAADHVVAGNEYLAEQFRQLGRAVTVLPTVVDPADYAVKQHQPTDAPGLVWIGSASTLPYLQQWMPALEEAGRRVPGLRLITIANETVRSSVLKVEHVPWSLETEAASLLRGDIGIAPTPMDAWSVGKSGFKIIQYMAAGLPSIASPVGANASIVEAGVTGLLPQTAQQWPEAIVALASDANRRAAMGAAARQTVERQYTLRRAKDVWARLLAS